MGIRARGVIVVVPSSSAAQLERLREELHDVPGEDVVTIFGDIGRFDAVVASLGQGCHGPPLAEVSFEMWERTLGNHLTPRCVIAHTFLPLLIVQGYGGYTSVERTATEYAVTHVDLNAIIEASQDMLVRVLSEELADTHVRINEALVCPNASVRRRARDPPEGLIDDLMGTVTHVWLLRKLHRCAGRRFGL